MLDILNVHRPVIIPAHSRKQHSILESFAHFAQMILGHWARDYVLRLFDALLWTAAAYVAGILWMGVSLEETSKIHVTLAYTLPLISFLLFPVMGCYKPWRTLDYRSMLQSFFLATMCVGLSAVGITFLMHEISSLSRMWFLMTLLIVFVTSALIRVIALSMLRWLRSNGFNLRRIMVISNTDMSEELMELVQENPGFGYKIIGMMGRIPSTLQQQGVEFLDQSTLVNDFITKKNIDEVWIAALPSQTDTLKPLIEEMQQNAVSIRWFPDLSSMTILGNRLENLMGHPSMVLNATALESKATRLAKSVFDRLFALFVLLMLSPLLAFIAVMVKISSPGPVLFRQLRQGVSGKPFHCLKFRTMVMHFEKGTITQATAQDSRITPIGRLLRKTSMDELPQFINVLLGNMSVVGPRPHALQHNEYYSKQVGRYMQRHMTKPGITGWAQINGYRGETDTLNKMAKRVEFDIYYMNNWSFWLDLKIIFWTAFRGWTGKNAY